MLPKRDALTCESIFSNQSYITLESLDEQDSMSTLVFRGLRMQQQRQILKKNCVNRCIDCICIVRHLYEAVCLHLATLTSLDHNVQSEYEEDIVSLC